VEWVDEIIVIDSYSNDRTLKIAQKYTDEIYHRVFDNFSKQRNFGLEQISSDWVLTIDADERISDELAKEIQGVLSKKSFNEGIEIHFKNHFLGKWIKYCGWYPDYHLRLFKRKKGDFGNNKVHENVEFKGEVGKLKGHIEHYTYRSISHFVEKTQYYTNLSAEEMYEQGNRFKIKDLIVSPLWRFIKMYFLKRGYKDGIHGFILSVLYFIYGFLKYTKLWELEE
jgi:glycosyltransferase involved in cell wall biosynthesis